MPDAKPVEPRYYLACFNNGGTKYAVEVKAISPLQALSALPEKNLDHLVAILEPKKPIASRHTNPAEFDHMMYKAFLPTDTGDTKLLTAGGSAVAYSAYMADLRYSS